MATLRKLQTEIEKTLKRVQEGLQVFDDYWEQVRARRTNAWQLDPAGAARRRAPTTTTAATAHHPGVCSTAAR